MKVVFILIVFPQIFLMISSNPGMWDWYIYVTHQMEGRIPETGYLTDGIKRILTD